jgi:LysM repeat protein
MKSRNRILVLAATVLSLLLLSAPVYAAPLATPGGSGCGQFYTVKTGDTLYRIAMRYHTSVAKLMALNALGSPHRIFAGQTLCVKPGGSLPMGFLYTVRPGDTLNKIGARYGWSAAYLAQVNRINNPNRIYVGQVLLIPYHRYP